MHRFHAPGFVLQRDVELPEEEGHHLAKVLRLKAGDFVAVFDGHGHEALASVQSVAGRRVTVRASERRVPAPEPAIAVTLAQALLKSDKMDRVIRDTVMLGVSSIQPVTTARTEVPRAAAGARQERWQRTVISSVKQCGRAVVPDVRPTLAWSELLAETRDTLSLMFVEPAAAVSDATATWQSLETRVPAKATILIGPEGGWDAEEISAAMAAGVVLVTMGQRVLRADAA